MSSKHNLSYSGPGQLKSTTETQVCGVCHVPHLGSSDSDRPAARAVAIDLLDGGSRACLGCHDGTVATARAVEPSTPLPPSTVELARGFGTSWVGLEPSGGSSAGMVGTDLGTSHPISVRLEPGEGLRSLQGTSTLRLDRGGRIQCSTCHEPHREDRDPTTRKFLRSANRASAMCLECHLIEGWDSNPASHQVSPKAFSRTDGAHTGYSTVADNGCEACHKPHGAAADTPLLKGVGSAVCIGCHAGRVASKDLRPALAASFGHPLLENQHAHDSKESSGSWRQAPRDQLGTQRHVTCVDCHNPHAAHSRTESAPFVSGALAGVDGLDAFGRRVSPARFEYEVCFKCHGLDEKADWSAVRILRIARRSAVPEANLRMKFDLSSAASYHPIEGPGRNPDVPSLIPPLGPSSVIYCSDCHANELASSGGPRGPHGSSYPGLLERNLSTQDWTAESPTAYGLCYKCHDREAVLSFSSPFPAHTAHVVRSRAPCNACHDPHGVSGSQGSSEANAHLIDFDRDIVRPSRSGRLEYVSVGPRMGRCWVSCHGVDHAGVAY
ncbi:MAG: hypothetical protein HYV07_32760 [Deltaproteobacteria bacterium]|nr:hypothetical protein [Deltaproteobacteria bacterium]